MDSSTTTTAATTTATTSNTGGENSIPPTTPEPLPNNRFELELEFVQSLASPAYLHFLATSKTEEGDRLLFQDPQFLSYLKYLYSVWSQPSFSRYLSYPHALYFLELILEQPAVLAKEWTLPEFRNFCHQQQFLSWQHRHSTLYGNGIVLADPTNQGELTENGDDKNNNNNNAAVEPTSVPSDNKHDMVKDMISSNIP